MLPANSLTLSEGYFLNRQTSNPALIRWVIRGMYVGMCMSILAAAPDVISKYIRKIYESPGMSFRPFTWKASGGGWARRGMVDRGMNTDVGPAGHHHTQEISCFRVTDKRQPFWRTDGSSKCRLERSNSELVHFSNSHT